MDDYGVSPEEGVVKMERVLPGPIERVWAYLTESDLRRQWLAGGDMELRQGAEFEWLFKHSEFTDEEPPAKYCEMNENGHKSPGRVIRCEPPHALAITWGGTGEDASEVLFELAPQGDEVLLTLTHRRLPNRGEMANVGSGWHAHLNALRTRLNGEVVTDFWASIAKLAPEYKEKFGVE